MKRIIPYVYIAGLLCVLTHAAIAQKNLRYTDARQLTLVGKATENKNYYHRIDTGDYPDIPATVKNLLTHSAGLAISFTTNSTAIAAKWCTSSRKAGNNMTAIAMEGLDLYIKRDGIWQYAGVGRPGKDDCTEFTLVKNMQEGDKECLLYLPLYDELITLGIGVDENASLKAAPDPFHRKVLLYGSSIAHGASASRPGLAYPARLSRETGLNIINWGVSGNAKMEKAVADMIAGLDADAFILDCVPNSSPEQVTERTAYLVKAIRANHPGKPIIAIQSIIRESGNFDQSIADRVSGQNQNFRREIIKLQQEDEHLFLITAEGMLGEDHEATADGIHPNDLGFDRMLQKIRPAVTDIFRGYGL